MDRIDRLVLMVVKLAGFGLMLVALLSVLLQVYIWLWSGEWLNLSLASILAIFTKSLPTASAWASSPSSWIGLHRLLDNIPAALPVAFFGYRLTHIE